MEPLELRHTALVEPVARYTIAEDHCENLDLIRQRSYWDYDL